MVVAASSCDDALEGTEDIGPLSNRAQSVFSLAQEQQRVFYGLDSYPGQFRLRDGAVRWRAAVVRRPGDVRVAWAVVVQQDSLAVHQLLILLQLRCHVLGTQLLDDAILAQVAVNSWVGWKMKEKVSQEER
ncbi:hypothetical protein ATANTOWER_011712 [Ataeniobius toweri]|uniref:Uncharacterized protein n=1 Tax=Ataeniobius toweri TaxID=208326 RepID=A0ABU7BH44_9TELE|nr:hypothetical protein [Ataeniobius toweri]